MLEETLRKALRTILEASVDTGVADDTSLVNRLDDSSKDWPVNAFMNLIVEITGGTGEEQIRKIASNTATSLVPVTNFATAPDSTSTYRIGFFGKMAGDITHLGGMALTGRDISLDFKALTDDSIKGLLKSIGDIAALENLITRIGQTSDAIVAAGAEGSIAAKLRRATQGLEDLKSLIVLAAGTNVIGKVGIDYSGATYVNSDTATSDAARRFETASKKLKDIVLYVETSDQLFGNASAQTFPVIADRSLGFTQVDISTLYFKNKTLGQNGTVHIIGVED